MATYPASLTTYTNKVDGVDVVLAADMNSVQSEIQAIEGELGTNPRTSALPASVGTYSASGTNTTVDARIKNLEAGLTGDATNGTRIGYTQLATGSLASTATSVSVTTTGYNKIVIIIYFSNMTAGTTVTMNANSSTLQKFGRFNYAASPTVVGDNAATTGLPITNAQAPNSGDVVQVEIYNASASGTKPVNWTNALGWGAGSFISGGTITGAITNITFSHTTAPTASTYYIYGVK
jgi:hypothetical protein